MWRRCIVQNASLASIWTEKKGTEYFVNREVKHQVNVKLYHATKFPLYLSFIVHYFYT